MTDIDFLLYELPGCGQVNCDLVWVEVMQLIDEDLQQILRMDHHRFWCQVRSNIQTRV